MNSIVQISRGELFMIVVALLAAGIVIGWRSHTPTVLADPLCLFAPSASSTNPLGI